MFERLDGLLDELPAASWRSLAVADIDGGGAKALVLVATDAPPAVLALRPGGPVRCDPGSLAEKGLSGRVVCAADVDGDGAEELLFVDRRPNGELAGRLCRLESGDWCAFAFGLPRPTVGAPAAIAVPMVGSHAGILLAVTGSLLRLYGAGPQGTVCDLAAEVGLDEFSPQAPLRHLPWPKPHGGLLFGAGESLWSMARDARGRFSPPLPVAAVGPAIRALLPLAGPTDGRLNVFAATASGTQQLLATAAEDTLVDVAPRLLAEPGPVLDAVAADFDGDGAEELLLLCDREPNRLFGWREGGLRPLDAGAATLPRGRHAAAAVVDLDLDGVPELLLLPASGCRDRPLVLRAAAARAERLVAIAPLSVGGAPARGAEVRIEIGGRWRRSVVDGGNGRIQGEPVVRFGLGAGRNAARVEVCWPDGSRLQLPEVAAGCLYRLGHPAASIRRSSAK
ncbi:hypothetical protein HRbin40_01400 [bacterium HR40]|nr:hypothetical protein HRbin40_01400 [bacterium HR40]